MGDIHRHRGSLRRPIDRRRTADFIATADLFTVAIVVGTAASKVPAAGDLKVFPWSLMLASAAALFVRMLLLLFLTGSLRLIMGHAIGLIPRFLTVVAGMVSGDDDGDTAPTAQPVSWGLVEKLTAGRRNRIRYESVLWYTLLGVGILAMVILVGASGGMANSPFRDLLIATFILGQFRSPTDKAIWTLFGLGLVAATSAHVLYILLQRAHPEAFSSLRFFGVSHIAPGFLVAFTSTLVYWLTFRNEIVRHDARHPDGI